MVIASKHNEAEQICYPCKQCLPRDISINTDDDELSRLRQVVSFLEHGSIGLELAMVVAGKGRRSRGEGFSVPQLTSAKWQTDSLQFGLCELRGDV